MNLEVTEGIAGMWHYHLRPRGELRALCGAAVMRTSVPLDRWNKKIPNYHIPESFCQKCNELREGHG